MLHQIRGKDATDVNVFCFNPYLLSHVLYHITDPQAEIKLAGLLHISDLQA